MRRTVTLAAAIVAAGLVASPAAAATPDWNSGLTFYNGTAPVANYADPDGSCTAFPSTATLLVGWSNVQDVQAWTGAGCTGYAYNLGTLRSFGAGQFKSFTAS
ncbi:hypothetical protein ACQP2X_28980 [Actinoplanes sp. CA-131856]